MRDIPALRKSHGLMSEFVFFRKMPDDSSVLGSDAVVIEVYFNNVREIRLFDFDWS